MAELHLREGEPIPRIQRNWLLRKIFGVATSRRPEVLIPRGAAPGGEPLGSAYEWYNQQVGLNRDRLSMYKEYAEMDHYDIISSALDIYCLAAGTQIPLLDGRTVAIEDLESEPEFWVYSCDLDSQRIVPGLARNARRTGMRAKTVIVYLDHGESVTCTANHRFLLRDGTYRCAEDLRGGESLMPLYRGETDLGYEIGVENPQKRAARENLQKGWRSNPYRTDLVKNHKVASVKGGPEVDVWDITVDKYHNFALSAGVFVHNSEDATQLDDLHKSTVWIETDDEDLVKHWQEMVANLDLEENLPGIVRSAAKNGDHFEQILYSQDEGVFGFNYLPVEFCEAVDHPETGQLLGYNVSPESAAKGIVPNSYVASRTHADLAKEAEKKAEYEPYDILHIKISGARLNNRYGDSLLRSGRRIWKQLKIMEDSVILYRINRAPDRLVFYIDVGRQSGTAEAFTILNEWRKWFKKRQFVDPVTGEYRAEYNPMCLTGDTKVRLLDGTSVPIRDLVGRDEFWVYSCTKNGEVRAGRGHSVRLTKRDETILRVVLDNGQVVRCNASHPFLLSSGVYKRVRDLCPGDSLMPLYSRVSDDDDELGGYERVHTTNPAHEEFTHRLTAPARDNACEICGLSLNDGKHAFRHHRNFDKWDNRPENLQWVTFSEHRRLHSNHMKELWKDPEFRKKISERCYPHTKEWCERHSEFMKEKCQDPEFLAATLDKGRSSAGERMRRRWKEDPEGISLNTDGLVAYTKSDEGRRQASKVLSDWNSSDYKRELTRHTNHKRSCEKCRNGMPCGHNLAIRPVANHKVVSVEPDGYEDVYDLTVDYYHNFALAAGVFVHNSQDEDLFIATTQSSATRIDRLAGSVNAQDIGDLQYFLNRLFACLKIPKAYMGFEGDLGGFNPGRTLAHQDIRFARTIKRVQRAMIVALTRLFQIHLAFKYEEKELREKKFKVRMSPVSYLDEVQKHELWSLKMDMARQMTEMGLDVMQLDRVAWLTYVLSEMMGFSDRFIKHLITIPLPEPLPDAGGGMGGGDLPPDVGVEPEIVGADELPGGDELGGAIPPDELVGDIAPSLGNMNLVSSQRRNGNGRLLTDAEKVRGYKPLLDPEYKQGIVAQYKLEGDEPVSADLMEFFKSLWRTSTAGRRVQKMASLVEQEERRLDAEIDRLRLEKLPGDKSLVTGEDKKELEAEVKRILITERDLTNDYDEDDYGDELA